MSNRTRVSLPVVPPGPSAPACRDAVDPHSDEFARGTSVWHEGFSRRRFLATSAATFALAGLTGCRDRPSEAIVPYVDPPEQITAGEPQFFATTLTRGGYGRGVIVTTREGRPIKIEGNPDHPASLGAADAQMQAAVLGLYDPLRSANVTHAGAASTWGAFAAALAAWAVAHDGDGSGLAVLSGAMPGMTTRLLYGQFKARFPSARWHVYEPLGPSTPGTAAQDCFYDLSACDVIVGFDSDFLIDEPGSLAYARQFADCRRLADRTTMNRLYVAEADFSVTGTRADHRLPCTPSRVGQLLVALAAQMGVQHCPMPGGLTAGESAWLSAAANDLNEHRGRSVVIIGRNQPQAVQDAAHALNSRLGNVGKTVFWIDDALGSTFRINGSREPCSTLANLVDDLHADRVKTLLILADNPARTAPADFGFADAVARLSQRGDTFTAHLGLYANETAFACQWHVPAQHELEMWADTIAFDGTASLVQPMIAPLTDGKSHVDVMNVLTGHADRSAYDTLRQIWRADRDPVEDAEFEMWWQDALRRGTVPWSTPDRSASEFALAAPAELPRGGGLEIVFRPDPSILDGSLFHNAWLQELPRPLTKIVWGNAALIAPATAARHGLADGDVVKLQAGDRSIEIPALIQPGVADDTVVLHVGHGAHRVIGGDAAWSESNLPWGVDVYPLRTSSAMHSLSNVTLTATGRSAAIVRTHNHHTMSAEVSADPSVKQSLSPQVIATPDTPRDDLELHNRKLIRTATLAEFAKAPDFAAAMDAKEIKQLYPPWNYDTGPQWGMTIDLTTCIGCNACITACQAENNTPSVGPEQVDKGREMHWLRVDSYLDHTGHAHHQPVACMQCENAPCEYVCPVAATTHSTEGLNQMTYNRCVGTRYCSNNCPYKVRRFNFFDYTSGQPESFKMQKNPDVTVRTRGVMEKCTYCVQRINYATRKTEIAEVSAGGDTAQLHRDLIGRLQTACQQTCPTRAITFGDLTDPDSPVSKSKRDPRGYGLLTELSTKPRTTYLASLTNPSPSFDSAPKAGPA